MGDSIKGLVVLITGASSGIGAGCAIEFAIYGARLALTGRNRERLEQTVTDCVAHGLNRDEIFVTTGDLKSQEDCARIVHDTMEYFNGHLDVLVNNAGESRRADADTAEIEHLDFCYETLLKSVFMMTKLSLPYLEKTKGTIINMSSVAGLRPYMPGLPYSMMKCGLDRLTQICAASPSVAGKGIRVNSVNPAVILTPMTTGPRSVAAANPEKLKKLIVSLSKTYPSGRVGDVSEVARLVVFLASKEAGYLNGTLFPIDGAYSNTSYIPKLEK